MFSVCHFVSCGSVGLDGVGMVAVGGDRGWLVLGFAASACACVSLCFLCGEVSCRVSRVVARYFLFVIRL